MAGSKEQLTQAFDLIRQDKLEEAMIIIRPITSSEPDNADAWWLMANAASAPGDARKALVNALKINPSYPRARDLLDKLNEMHPPNDQELMMMLEIEEVEDDFPVATASASGSFFESSDDSPFGSSDDSSDPFGASSEIDDLFGSSDAAAPAKDVSAFSFEEGQEAAAPGEEVWWLPEDENPFAVILEEGWKPGVEAGESASNRTKIIGGVIAAGVLAVVCLLVVVVGLGGGDKVAPNADPGALARIDPASISAENADALDLVRSGAETDARLLLGADSSAIFTQVTGGYALVVQLCAEPDPELPGVVLQGMDIAVTRGIETQAVRELLTMVGVSVSDCARSDTLYRALVPIEAAADFNASEDMIMAFANFQEQWVIEN